MLSVFFKLCCDKCMNDTFFFKSIKYSVKMCPKAVAVEQCVFCTVQAHLTPCPRYIL